jgi:hypothetical protein
MTLHGSLVAAKHCFVISTHVRHCCGCLRQVLYTVYDSAMLQPLLDTVNEEKAKAAAEEA